MLALITPGGLNIVLKCSFSGKKTFILHKITAHKTKTVTDKDSAKYKSETLFKEAGLTKKCCCDLKAGRENEDKMFRNIKSAIKIDYCAKTFVVKCREKLIIYGRYGVRSSSAG